MGAAWTLFALLCGVGLVHGQEMRDPTRPPGSLSLPAGTLEAPQPSGPQLQSVRISAHHSSAIISGHQVGIGDQLGDARVTAISENDVTLRGPGGVQTLKLFPGIGKRSVVRSAPFRPRHSRQVQ